MKRIRIGYIHATNELDVQWYKPLSYGYLKSYLHANLDTTVDMQFVDNVDEIEPYDIVAVSSTSQDYGRAIEIAQAVKRTKQDVITIIGGHHITYMPETMVETFDVGVRGEGEETFLAVIRNIIDNGFRLDYVKLHGIKGLALHENGKVVTTGIREPISPMDSIPHPVREADNNPYMFTSRGCPYKCSFCSSSAFWDKTRFFSAEYVIEEIEDLLENYPDITNIPIWDDIFIVNKQRFLKFIELAESKGITKRVSFNMTVRANLVDDELCENLKRLNVAEVGFGAESGSDKTLDVLGKNVTAEQNQNAIDILNRHGFVPGVYFIVGVPTETEDDVRMTYEFIIRNLIEGKVIQPAVNILMPLPGTKMWDYAVEKGIIITSDIDWKRLSVFASYKSSNINSLDEWIEHRLSNNSYYLAEETLPQERLYRLMGFYGRTIDAIEGMGVSLKEREASCIERDAIIKAMRDTLSWRITAPLRWLKGLVVR